MLPLTSIFDVMIAELKRSVLLVDRVVEVPPWLLAPVPMPGRA
jgi:hypothetical protein